MCQIPSFKSQAPTYSHGAWSLGFDTHASSACLRELVSDAPRREDQLRVVGIELDLAPQPADRDVDGPLAGVRVLAPDVLQQRRAAEHHPRARRQLVQDVELLPREVDAMAPDVGL